MAKKKKDEKPQEDSIAIPADAAPEQQAENAQPSMQILAQYIKDISFENPGAPNSLRAGLPAPAININIEIGRQMLDDNTVEVVLMLAAKAERDGKAVFLAELEYAGLFAFNNIEADQVQPMILIECPRMLFPFARQILAEATQNGGYPPIMLDPPDFAAMFRDEMLRRAAQQGESTAVN